MSADLTNKAVKDTYQRLIQISGSQFYDGLGNPISIDVSGSTNWDDLTNVPSGIISSSTQVDYTQIQNQPTIPSTDGLATTASLNSVSASLDSKIDSVSASFADTINNLPSGGGSGSGSNDWDDLVNVPAGLVSSSTQIDYTQIQNQPTIPSTDGLATTASLNSVSASFATTIDNLPTDTDTTYEFINGLTETNNTASIDYDTTTNIVNRAPTWSAIGSANDNILIQDATTNLVYKIPMKSLGNYGLVDGVGSASFDARINAIVGVDYGGASNIITDADTFNTADNDASVDKIIVFHDGDEGVQDASVADFKTAYDIQDSVAYTTDSASFDSRIDINSTSILTNASNLTTISSSLDTRVSANNTKTFQNEATIVALGNNQTTLSSSFDSRLDDLESAPAGGDFIPLTEGGHTTTSAGDFKGDTLNLPTATLTLGEIYAYNQGTFDLPIVHSGSSNIDDALVVAAVNTDSADGVLTRGTFTTLQSLSGLTNGSPLYFESGSGDLITSSVANVGDVDVKVGHILNASTNLIYFSPSTAKKKEDDVISSGSGGGITPTAEEWAYQRIQPYTDRTSFEIGDTAWHIQQGTYDYLMPSGNNITFAAIDQHASESQVRSGTFYGIAGDGSDLLGPTILKENNQFGNKYRFTDDAGNPSDATTSVIHQHVHFRNHSFSGATDGYIIDHLTGLGFHNEYYQSGSAFNMRASDGGVDWATWIDYINNANHLGYTDWRPYSVAELAGTALGAYIAGGGLQYPWSDDFFNAEAIQGGSQRFCALLGETAIFNTSMFAYGEDTNTIDLTDDLSKSLGTTFTHRIMNIFMVRNHY